MKQFSALALIVALPTASAFSDNILQPGDAVIGIDTIPTTSSNYPGAEGPINLFDGDTATKYLNFGGIGSGFIVTPAAGSSIVQSLGLSTANDSPNRDPTSYFLYGTNDAIVSTDNSTGLGGETWDLISSGGLTLPDLDPVTFEVERFAAYPIVDFANATAYTSYKLVFPSNVNPGFFVQLSEAQLFTGAGGTGTAVLSTGDTVLGIDEFASSPNGETAINAIDGDINTKYLNFGQAGSGIIVTPTAGSSVAKGIQLVTANDFADRDATSFEVYGTNDPITSVEYTTGDAENWTLIDSGSITLPEDRLAESEIVAFENDTAYTSYRIVFPTLKDELTASSFQVAEIRLLDEVVPLVLGDADGDGDVDDTDLGIAISNFTGPGGTGKTLADGDTDGDGDVDDTDLGVMISGFTGPLSPAAVPEPTSLALLGLGGLLVARRRR